jgi:chromatin assembly factor 1 subunit B
MVRQIAEHNHYVQGVSWDPLNEYVATQSSDRSVHIYNLRTKDGQFTLKSHNKITKMDLPARQLHGQSPAQDPTKSLVPSESIAPASPAPSASIPGTPTSLALPMNPPVLTQSRRSSFASSPSHRRSASPAPSIPLPAVRPMEHSPLPFTGIGSFKNTNIYANETYTSFFRRLTFAPDGSLLFTPAGQYKISHPPTTDGSKVPEDIQNTVYIYTRAGLNKPPIAHLPGHKKASIAVKCSPVYYTLRQTPPKPTVQITLDTSSADEAIPALPEPVVPTAAPSAMDPPTLLERSNSSMTVMPSPKDIGRPTSSPREQDTTADSPGPTPAFALPYRMVYAVATQDSILVYDTQQQVPLCVVSNLHFTTFTDLAWSSDGLTLLMSSTDGFCSTISFAPGELGQIYTGPIPHAHGHHHSLSIGTSNSAQPSPIPTPTASTAPSFTRVSSSTGTTFASPNPHGPSASPTKSRSNSVSSIATQSSHAPPPTNSIVGNSPTPTMGTVPGVTASNSGSSLPLSTPPATPMPVPSIPVSNGASLGKRDVTNTVETDVEERQSKKRRIAPTPVTEKKES